MPENWQHSQLDQVLMLVLSSILSPSYPTNNKRGRSGGAMILGKLSVPGRPTCLG